MTGGRPCFGMAKRTAARIATRFAASLAAGSVLLASAQAAFAQAWPAQPLRLVVPYAPGSTVDLVGRTVGACLAEELGQAVVIDNRPGAAGVIGVDAVARSAPDGHTLLVVDPAIVINPHLQDQASHAFPRGLTTLGIVGSSPLVAAVNGQLPIETIGALVGYIRGNRVRVNFASAGIGTTTHLAGELFRQRLNLSLTHVPYKGIGPAYADLAGGQVQLIFGSITGALPFFWDARLRPLAVTGAQRSSALPDVPTMTEAGVPDFRVDLWLGVFAPAALPMPIADRLNLALRRLVEHPTARAGFAKAGVEPVALTREAATTFVLDEYRKWSQVIRDARLKGVN